MVLDTLHRADRYVTLCKGLQEAFAFLRRADIRALEPGRYDIVGEHMYASVMKGDARKEKDALLEIHRKYVDVQYVIEGDESIGWKPASGCVQPSMEYDEQRDVRFFADIPEFWCRLVPGSFALFFPNDAHAPMIGSGVIHKVVVKLALDQEAAE